jgi:hypothetical protein
MIKRQGRFLIYLMIGGLLLSAIGSCLFITNIFPGDARKLADSLVPFSGRMITVQPAEIDDILYNPGIGFADFHFGWGHPPGPVPPHDRRLLPLALGGA